MGDELRSVESLFQKSFSYLFSQISIFVPELACSRIILLDQVLGIANLSSLRHFHHLWALEPLV